MRRRAAALAACLVVAGIAGAARADIDVRIEVGHGGRWVAECATPVTVTLRNTGSEAVGVSLALSETDRLSSRLVRYERRVFIGAGATRREHFLTPSPEPYDGSLGLLVVTEPSVPVVHEGEVASRGRMDIDVRATRTVAQAAVPYSGRIVAVIGDERGVLSSRLPNAVRRDLLNCGTDLNDVSALPVSEEHLALGPLVLEGFDALVVIAPDESTFADRATLDAVLDWVALGGTLVVSPDRTASGLRATALGPYLPELPDAPVSLDARRALTELARSAKEKVETPPAERPLTAWPLPATEGVPRLAETIGLWADRRLGAGTVRLLAVDARTALRVASDPGHLIVLATALTGRPAPIDDPDLLDYAQTWTWSQTVDVEAGVANVLRQDAFEPPPLIVILGLLALYVLIVGPVDRLVLRRLGRQRLTTLTFGGAVIAFTVFAYAASFLVFSAGQVVNRMVLVDLQDGGRDGRQLIRVHDLAGYYSPRGTDIDVEYTLPAAVLGSNLPGGGSAAEVGMAYPVLVGGTDPLSPLARVQVAFRSQKALRVTATGVTGRTIETEWVGTGDDGGGRPALRIVNGLPVDLTQCTVIDPRGGAYRCGPLAAGAERVVQWRSGGTTPGAAGALGTFFGKDPAPAQVTDFLAFLSRLSPTGLDGRPVKENAAPPVSLQRQAVLTRTGIARGSTLGRGDALLLATAARAPVPLPADDLDGRTHVLIRKQLRIRRRP